MKSEQAGDKTNNTNKLINVNNEIMKNIQTGDQMSYDERLVSALQEISDNSWFAYSSTAPSTDDWGEAVVGWRPINPKRNEARKTPKQKFEPSIMNYSFDETNRILPYQTFRLKSFSTLSHTPPPIFSSYCSPFFESNHTKLKLDEIFSRVSDYSLNLPPTNRKKNKKIKNDIEVFQPTSKYLFFPSQEAFASEEHKQKLTKSFGQYSRTWYLPHSSKKHLHKSNSNDIILPTNNLVYKKSPEVNHYLKFSGLKNVEKKSNPKNLYQEAIRNSKLEKKRRNWESIRCGIDLKTNIEFPANTSKRWYYR